MRSAQLFLTTLMATAVASVSLVGCDVKKTQEGNVTLPKYEKTKEGDVTLPKYDVTAPEVTVKKEEKEVYVPKVVAEKETVTVPKVELKTGKEKAAEKEEAKK